MTNEKKNYADEKEGEKFRCVLDMEKYHEQSELSFNQHVKLGFYTLVAGLIFSAAGLVSGGFIAAYINCRYLSSPTNEIAIAITRNGEYRETRVYRRKDPESKWELVGGNEDEIGIFDSIGDGAALGAVDAVAGIGNLVDGFVVGGPIGFLGGIVGAIYFSRYLTRRERRLNLEGRKRNPRWKKIQDKIAYVLVG